MAILRKVDPTFSSRNDSFRAQNADGFAVDLIRADEGSFVRLGNRISLGDSQEDLRGAPIFGLQWLLNAPRLEEIAIAEDGYPIRLVVPDPRAFALHKLWISDQSMREPVKQPRDRAQAAAIVEISQKYLGLSFDSKDILALPRAVRDLVATIPGNNSPSTKPKW